MLADLLTAAATGAGGGGVGVAIVQAVFNRGGRRAEAAKSGADTEALHHDTWFSEAKDAYARAKQECLDCRDELRKAITVQDELRRDLVQVRDALVQRINVIDQLLPYVQGMPDKKMHDIRAANRALKSAIYK